MGESTCRITAIDENLMRGDLSTAEGALHVTERKRLYEEQHPETKNGGDRKSAKISSPTWRSDANRLTKHTAEKTGISERAIQRDASGGSIGGERG